MNILVSNDDGIQAEGIKRLAQALSQKGQVYVVAPDQQRSASSHALSLQGTLQVTEVKDFPGAKQAWKTSGTPADCVKLGLDILKRQGIEVDIVYAGINHGANLGSDTMYSGTVSAAAEGAFAGYPAVAVSVCDHHPLYFDGACRLAVSIFDQAIKTAGRTMVISLNTPNIPLEELKGIRIARLGKMTYDGGFHETEPEIYQYKGTLLQIEEDKEDVDARFINEGYATVSAIKYDLNDYEGLKELEGWELSL